MLQVRVERAEVRYSGWFSECDTEELIRLCAAHIERGDTAKRISYEDISDFDRQWAEDGDLLQINVNNKYPCSHIAEVEWYYAEETDEYDDGYYDESRRFYEDDYSPEEYEGWHQQDIIDSYRRER